MYEIFLGVLKYFMFQFRGGADGPPRHGARAGQEVRAGGGGGEEDKRTR